MRPYPFYLAYVIPATAVLGGWLQGIYTFSTAFFTFIVVPLADLFGGTDRTDPHPADRKMLAERLDFKFVTILYAPVHVGVVLWGAYTITHAALSTIEMVGITVSVGIATGAVGITVAHELFHKSGRVENTLGQLLLLCACYMHFYVEHMTGHHANVCTPGDPSSARLGESLYAFLPRTVVNSFRSASRLEAARLKASGRQVWSYRNRIVRAVVLPLLVASVLGVVFGWGAALYFIAQGIVAFSILETINYVEHYGLERKELSPGRFEHVSPAHAWDADLRMSNYFFFKLQRHADHHLHPTRRYHVLRHDRGSPRLPAGYGAMALLALVPPLWRRVMDRRALECRHGVRTTQAVSGDVWNNV